MKVGEVIQEVSKALRGKEEVIEKALLCLLAEGHLLIEDVPGVGKTTLALSLSKVLDLSFARIQFTTDLMPSDITGTSIFDQRKKDFVFKEGPIFNNVVLADEINRATPKTQSALLEAMAEKQVTVDGVTYPLPRPFFVIATQNPMDHYGTFPLPESQLDRFTMRISVGYPSPEVEVSMVSGTSPIELVQNLRVVLSKKDLLGILEEVKRVFIGEDVAKVVVDLVRFTREDPRVILGVSPRGSIHLATVSKAKAYLRERDFVVPEDVLEVAPYVLSHRMIVREGSSGEEVIKDAVKTLKESLSYK